MQRFVTRKKKNLKKSSANFQKLRKCNFSSNFLPKNPANFPRIYSSTYSSNPMQFLNSDYENALKLLTGYQVRNKSSRHVAISPFTSKAKTFITWEPTKWHVNNKLQVFLPLRPLLLLQTPCPRISWKKKGKWGIGHKREEMMAQEIEERWAQEIRDIAKEEDTWGGVRLCIVFHAMCCPCSRRRAQRIPSSCKTAHSSATRAPHSTWAHHAPALATVDAHHSHPRSTRSDNTYTSYS